MGFKNVVFHILASHSVYCLQVVTHEDMVVISPPGAHPHRAVSLLQYLSYQIWVIYLRSCVQSLLPAIFSKNNGFIYVYLVCLKMWSP